MRQRFYRILIELTNGPFLSRVIQKFVQSSLSKGLIKPYAKVYKINLDEMESSLDTFNNLHSFFTRKIKSDYRPIDNEQDTVISPVDGILEDVGIIDEKSIMTVKGKLYSIEEMLGNKEWSKRYKGGHYLIIYLSPAHYHRIHSPATAQIVRQYKLGSKSYPVNRLGLKYGEQTLAKNFRIITELNNKDTRFAMVKVGAMFINSIEILQNNNIWQKGEEVAYFTFGSTVILLFEKDAILIEEKGDLPVDVKVGEVLGRMRR